MLKSLKLWSRALAIAFLVLLFFPFQWLAIRFNFSWRRHLPVFFHRMACRIIGLRVTVIGQPTVGRALMLVSNHVSWLDILVLGSVGPLSFIAKAEVASWPAFGFLARLQGTVFIDRTRKADTQSVNRAVAARLQRGDVMVLFAEGTTGDGTRILPFRSALLGAARDAAGATSIVDVQPVSLSYPKRGGLPLTATNRANEIAWVGDIELLPNLIGILTGLPVDAVVRFGDALPFGPATNRKIMTRTLETSVRQLTATTLRGRDGL